VRSQKLIKPELLKIYTKLGYPLPETTRKEDLVDDLNGKLDALSRTKPAKNASIISLDMGVKNMAMTRIEYSNHTKTLPCIQQWFKMDLDDKDVSFNPINYSKITTDFLNSFILNKNLSENATVTLERQRYRTRGSSNVLESTLRTNTIESMLCMGLTVYNEQTKRNKIDVISSVPGSMVKYWQNEFRVENMSEKDSKLFRIELVLKLLSEELVHKKVQPTNIKPHALQYCYLNDVKVDRRFQLSNELTENIRAALNNEEWHAKWEQSWSFKSKSRRLWEVCKSLNAINREYQVDGDLWGVVKGDDLADSLLHGVSHYEYLRNRRDFLKIVKNEAKVREFL